MHETCRYTLETFIGSFLCVPLVNVKLISLSLSLSLSLGGGYRLLDRDVGARGPHLGGQFAIPTPAEDILPRREVLWNADLVHDDHFGGPVARARTRVESIPD